MELATFEKLRRIAVAQSIDDAIRKAESFSIFLAGPYVQPEEPADADVNAEISGKRLRYFLYHSLSGLGHSIYLGEDTELSETGAKHYGSLNNAVIFERHYIVNHADAVIVLPSSPGSFCEIGDWVSDKNICEDMLILIDKIYEGSISYISEGVLRFAKSNHAEIVYQSYDDFDRALIACTTFIETVAERRRVEKLYGRTA